MVMLDHQGAHGPSLIWIRTTGLADFITSLVRVALRTAIVRIRTNVGWLRQADAIVTVTTTKTIIREHETDLVVREARAVADDVVVLTLADPRGGELPPWTPGAHIDLMLGDDLTRQYSLCSSPSKPDAWRVGVLRAPDSRGGSEWVHTALTPGSTVRVRGPRNHFPLVASSALPVHRGRHWNNADTAHDRGGRGGRRGLAPALRRPRTGVNGLPRRIGRVRRPGDDRAAGRDGHARSGIRPRDAARQTRWSIAAARRVSSARSRNSARTGHRARFTSNGSRRSPRSLLPRSIHRSSSSWNAPV